MKITTIIITSLIAFNVSAQNNGDGMKELEAMTATANIYNNKVLLASSTTETEYNYVVNGLPTSLTNSLDLKSGYSLDGYKTLDEYKNAMVNYSVGNYQFTFTKLIRTVDKSIAAIVLKIVSSTSNKTYYKCLPVVVNTVDNSTEMLDKFKADVKGWSPELQSAFIIAYFEYTTNALLLENSFTNKVKDTNKAPALLKEFGINQVDAVKISDLSK